MEHWADTHYNEEYTEITTFQNWRDKHYLSFKKFVDDNEFEITEHYNKDTLMSIAETYIDNLKESQTLEFTIDEILDEYYRKSDITKLYKKGVA